MSGREILPLTSRRKLVAGAHGDPYDWLPMRDAEPSLGVMQYVRNWVRDDDEAARVLAHVFPDFCP